MQWLHDASVDQVSNFTSTDDTAACAHHTSHVRILGTYEQVLNTLNLQVSETD